MYNKLHKYGVTVIDYGSNFVNEVARLVTEAAIHTSKDSQMIKNCHHLYVKKEKEQIFFWTNHGTQITVKDHK